MTTFLCEINPAVAKTFHDGVKFYLVKAKHNIWSDNTNFPQRLMANADRVWRIKENGDVDFVKNRFTGIMTKIDQRELTLALLSAVCYNSV